jgi:RNA polymerase sigma-70 factor, ECF subfamily
LNPEATDPSEVNERMGFAAVALGSLTERVSLAPPTADEKTLVHAATGGDRLAFRALYERTSAAAYRMAMRIVHQSDLSEEIVQEAFCQAWAGMRNFKGQSTFSTWVLSIARHVALDALRRARSRRTLPGADHLDEQPGRSEHVDARMRGAELGAALSEALAELPEESRTAFQLAALEKLPYAEVAAVLGTTTDGIKCRVFRAREHLRARLSRFEDER